MILAAKSGDFAERRLRSAIAERNSRNPEVRKRVKQKLSDENGGI